MEKKEDQAKKLEIVVDDEVAVGSYINLALINHSPEEFTMDFIYVPPNSPKAKLRARVISCPAHTKRFLMALQENLRRYEEKFGAINIGPNLQWTSFDNVGHS